MPERGSNPGVLQIAGRESSLSITAALDAHGGAGEPRFN